MTADIFTWADDNYVDGIEPSFGIPTGDVFMAEVTFIDDITSDEAQYLCFDDATNCICAGTLGDMYYTIIIDCTEFVDGIFNTENYAGT